VKSYQITDFGRPLAGVDLPDPKPTGDEVVIAVKAAGVCHSDLQQAGSCCTTNAH
jgi:D-arabinose 1-dehydrogenase-like Zn-dependent alcohol dehydrogenase